VLVHWDRILVAVACRTVLGIPGVERPTHAFPRMLSPHAFRDDLTAERPSACSSQEVCILGAVEERGSSVSLFTGP